MNAEVRFGRVEDQPSAADVRAMKTEPVAQERAKLVGLR
jgi:hypothetical protein